MRSLVVALVLLAGLAFTATPVFACLNDREVEHAEKEFKSRYEPQPEAATPRLSADADREATPSPAPREDERTPISDMLLIGIVGSVLLVTSFGATYVVHRRQKADKA